MGRIYKRPNSPFYWYSIIDEDGKLIRQSTGVRDEKTAMLILSKVEVEIAEGQYFKRREKKAKITFEQMAEKYLEWSQVNKRSWERDKRTLKILKGFFRVKMLKEISPFLIEGFKIKRIKEVSPRTVNLELACLKHLFSKAIEWDEAKDNPVKRVKFFRVNNARTRYLTEEEIFRLIDACDGQLKSIILLALHTGMRRGEIFRLKWSDVDFRSGNIIVTLSKNGECRKIPMNETADNVLRELKKEAASEFVFRNRYNENEPPKDIKTAFNNAVKKAGIENFRFHDLRHTFASHLVMNGVDLKTVQEFLGHKTFIMTLRYSHLSPAHRREAIKVMDLVAKDLKKHTNCTLVNFSGQAESETC